MAVTAFTRLRMLWGAFDWQHGTDNPYTAVQTKTGGDSAVATGGIGVRRVDMVIDRATAHPSADPALCHFDWLNITGGTPDDTWTTADYTSLETLLNAFWTSMKIFLPTGFAVTTYNWYRIGDGVVPPNPAQRQLILSTPILGTGGTMSKPPQVATSLTFRTAVRRSWGRTYLPTNAGGITATGNQSTGDVDAIAGYANTMITGAATNDMHLVVVSKPLHATLNVEHVEVDDNWDVVRRRRWKSSTYKKIIP